MKQLNLESLETRTLLAVGDVLDGEMADKVADLAGKLIEDVFAGDMEKFSDAEALAKKYLGVADAADETGVESTEDVKTDDAEPKKKSKVKKLTSKFEKLAGGFFDKLTGHDSEDDASEDGASDQGEPQDEGDSSGILDKIGDVIDTVEGVVDKVTDKINIFGDQDPDKELDASSDRLSGILDRVRTRIHAFGGEDSPAGGKVGLAAAHLMDVTGDVIDNLTSFIDDATDATPEREQRIETALKIAAAALEGVSGVSSLVGVAVPGVSAAAPALNAASDVLENASGKTSTVVKAAEKVGNIIGKGGHTVAGVLDRISDKLDPTADADEVAEFGAEPASGEGDSVSDEVVVALDNETEVLVA